MNVAIYARVSTEWQVEHGYSIGTQLEACRKKAEALGAFVVKEYVDDGYSGGFLERPALDELRDAVNDGLYDAIICHDADRLSRKLIHQLILTEEFEKHQCKPIFVLGEVTNTPEGQMTYQMKGVFAEYERAKIRERTMRGKRAKLKAGKAINDSHIYGYDFDKSTSTYVVNPAEAEIIKQIYQWFVVDRVGGCEAIVRKLNAKGVPSPSGGKWCNSTVHSIIHRPHYTGKYFANTYYHKKTGLKSSKKIPRPQSEWIPMTCPAIISEELHQQALDIKSTNRTFKTFVPLHDSLIQGLAYCADCGDKIRLHSSSSRWYSCNGRKNGCKARFAKIKIVDGLVWALIARLCDSVNSLTTYINSRSDAPQREPQSAKKRQALISRLKKVETERKVVMSWFSQSLLGQNEATEKLQALKDEDTRLRAELAVIDGQQDETDRLDPKDICEAVRNCPDDFNARRRVVLAIIDKVSFARHDTRKGDKYDIDIDIQFK